MILCSLHSPKVWDMQDPESGKYFSNLRNRFCFFFLSFKIYVYIYIRRLTSLFPHFVLVSFPRWAVVKDREVAIKMTKFIELNSIGVSRESQHRAAVILGAVSDSSQSIGDNFFRYGKGMMAERWTKLKEVISHSKVFSLPKYIEQYCRFSCEDTEPHPGT